MSRVLSLALLAAVAFPASAAAWNSQCTNESGARCADGFDSARSRLQGSDDEHRTLFVRALNDSGLPSALLDEFGLRWYAEANTVTAGSNTYPSRRPELTEPDVIVTQRVEIAEMAQLPDFSWSLADWAQQNETCPVTGSWDAATCHDYSTHLGPLNSGHFLPQARYFWAWYHQLAVTRAQECSVLYATLVAAGGNHAERFEEDVLACEKEAMLVEAVAQHYLQDAWSMGHMWERWGGPDFAHLPPPLAGGDDPMAYAFAVAAFSGLFHGAKEIYDHYVARFPLLPNQADDPMCAPPPTGSTVEWRTGCNHEGEGIGDLFVELGDPSSPNYQARYESQTASLMGCSINSMREVYQAGPQLHDPIGPVAAGAVANLSLDPNTSMCWQARATNGSLDVSMGIHGDAHPNQTLVLCPNPAGACFGRSENATAGVLAVVTAGVTGSPLSVAATRRLRWDVGRVLTAVKNAPSHESKLASGELPSVLGMERNGDPAYLPAGIPGLQSPASWADTAMPWTLGGGAGEAALTLVFADAHAADRCTGLSATNLTDYQTRATNAVNNGDWFADAACGVCADMVSPHLRIGTGPANYDGTREPLCGLVAPAAAPFVYYAPEEAPHASVDAAARGWCGCGQNLVTLTDDVNGGVAGFDVVGTSFDLTDIDAAGDWLLEGGQEARGVAVGGPGGGWAYLGVADWTSSWLSVFNLDPLDGTEVDTDFDTSNGPTLKTLLSVEPRGVAALHDRPYVLVALEGGIEVVHTDELETVRFLDPADLGTVGSERPWDIVVNNDDSKAYVSLSGTLWAPGNRVAVLDLGAILDGMAGVVTSYITTGADTNPRDMAMSHDGSKVAVVLPGTSRVLAIDTATDDWFDVQPFDLVFSQWAENEGCTPSGAPVAVAWQGDDQAVYTAYSSSAPNFNSSLYGYGVVRKCIMPTTTSDGWCMHEVGVEGSPRALTVTGAGDDTIVWVTDDLGQVTPLESDLFEPRQPAVWTDLQGLYPAGMWSGSGEDNLGQYDCTGGCLYNFGGFWRADACPRLPTLTTGGPLPDYGQGAYTSFKY